MNEFNFNAVSDSQIVLKELMVPSYENFNGKVHGGVILSLMDKIAYACAASHSKQYCVTASIDKVDFLNPVEVGELLTLYSSVNYTGKTSMEIGIRVVSEDFKTSIFKHTNTSYFTMVALERETKIPKNVPGLILNTEDEVRRFIEGKLRRKLKRLHSNDLCDARNGLDMQAELESLDDENCWIVKSALL